MRIRILWASRLDLNGRSLGGYPLNVGGAGRSGKLTVIDARGNGTLGLAVRDGGEVTAGGSKDTTYSIAVYGGTLEIHRRTYNCRNVRSL